MTKQAFLYTFTGSVDEKGRLSIPSDYREAMAPESLGCLVFAPGTSDKPGQLMAFPLDYFQTMFDGLDADSPEFADEEQGERYAVLFHDSVQKKIDAQGRVTLPQQILGKAGITKEVVFAGERTHFAVWEPAAYEAYRAKMSITASGGWKRVMSIRNRNNKTKE